MLSLHHVQYTVADTVLLLRRCGSKLAKHPVGAKIQLANLQIRVSSPDLLECRAGGAWGFAEAFDWKVWAALVLTAAAVGVLIAAFELLNCCNQEARSKALHQFPHWMWHTVGLLASVHFGLQAPRNGASKIILLAYGFMVLMVVGLFTGGQHIACTEGNIAHGGRLRAVAATACVNTGMFLQVPCAVLLLYGEHRNLLAVQPARQQIAYMLIRLFIIKMCGLSPCIAIAIIHLCPVGTYVCRTSTPVWHATN